MAMYITEGNPSTQCPQRDGPMGGDAVICKMSLPEPSCMTRFVSAESGLSGYATRRSSIERETIDSALSILTMVSLAIPT